MKVVAREGSLAPGTTAGVRYGDFIGPPELNDLGQLAFGASLTGAGVTVANDYGLFAYDPVLGTVLIAREGELFDVGGGDLRRIDEYGLIFDLGVVFDYDSRMFLSNNGHIVFALRFTDGSSGVFTAAIQPQPLFGDYNNDGSVDAADYIVWRHNLGESTIMPNDRSPGTVSQDDYDEWRANFGRNIVSAAVDVVSGANVPEPTSIVISIVGLILASRRPYTTRLLHGKQANGAFAGTTGSD
jgi:hypothetical protein